MCRYSLTQKNTPKRDKSACLQVCSCLQLPESYLLSRRPQVRRKKFPEFSRLFQSNTLIFPHFITKCNCNNGNLEEHHKLLHWARGKHISEHLCTAKAAFDDTILFVTIFSWDCREQRDNSLSFPRVFFRFREFPDYWRFINLLTYLLTYMQHSYRHVSRTWWRVRWGSGLGNQVRSKVKMWDTLLYEICKLVTAWSG